MKPFTSVETRAETSVPSESTSPRAPHRLISFRRRPLASLPVGGFIRNVGVLVGGTAIGQAITVAAAPVLTRLYAPEDFGTLGVFGAFLGICTVLACLRYELAIPIPKKDEDAAAIVVLSLAVIPITSATLGLGLWCCGDSLSIFANAPAIRPYLWLLPIGMALVGVYGVLNYWAIRKKAFGRIAHTNMSQSIASVTTQILLFPLGLLGLLLGKILGSSVGVTTLGSLMLTSNWQELSSVKAADLHRMAVVFRRFPLLSTWTSLFNTASVQLPTILLSSFFGTTVTGLYLLGFRVLQMPLGLVGRAVGQVFFSNAAQWKRESHLAAQVERIYRVLLAIGSAILLPMLVAAPEAFALAFGQEWDEAGRYVQFLTPWLLLVFVSSPLASIPFVLDRQKVTVFFQGALLVARVSAVVVGGMLGDASSTIFALALVSAAGWVVFMLWNLRIAGLDWGRIGVNLSYGLLPSLLPVALLLAVKVGTRGAFRHDLIVTAALVVSIVAALALQLCVWRKSPNICQE